MICVFVSCLLWLVFLDLFLVLLVCLLGHFFGVSELLHNQMYFQEGQYLNIHTIGTTGHYLTLFGRIGCVSAKSIY